MNKEKFEEAWALPTLLYLCGAIENIDPRKDTLGFGAALFGGTEPTLHITDQAPAKQARGLWVLFGEAENSDKRIALYRSCGLFDEIHALLKTMDINDDELITKVNKGELPISRRAKRGGQALTTADNKWLGETYYARFMEIEKKLLIKLKDEVELRVKERRRGLTTIFDLTS